MNQLDTDLQIAPVTDIAHTAYQQAEAARRLAVVVLEVEEEALLASRILELARPLDLPILLVGIAPDPADERTIRRHMVTLAAFLREGNALSRSRPERNEHAIRVEIQIVPGRDWPAKVNSVLQRGDMLACYSEQVIGSLQRPLTDILASSTDAPIYAFSGLRSTEKGTRNLLSQAAAWLVSLASIGACFLVQARIVTAVQGWAQSTLLILTLVAEAGLIWLVNSLFTQS